MSQLIEQQRAHFALKAIEKKRTTANLKSRANALPAMVQRNGLGQTLAFVKTKVDKDPGWQVMYQIVSDWLTRETKLLTGHKDALTALTQTNMHTYRLAQAEAQALLLWVRKFARALITSEQQEA
jgi:CRISPR-associated protein Cmr5